MMGTLLVGSTATAFALVAHVTGHWGAAVWAMVLAPLSASRPALDACARRLAAGGVAA